MVEAELIVAVRMLTMRVRMLRMDLTETMPDVVVHYRFKTNKSIQINSHASNYAKEMYYRGDCCIPSVNVIIALESEFICDISRLSLLISTDGDGPLFALFDGNFLIVDDIDPPGLLRDCCCCNCFFRCFIDCCC